MDDRGTKPVTIAGGLSPPTSAGCPACPVAGVKDRALFPDTRRAYILIPSALSVATSVNSGVSL